MEALSPFQWGEFALFVTARAKSLLFQYRDIYILGVIFNYKEFLQMSTPVNNPDGLIQTIGKKEVTPQLKRAKELQVATDIAAYCKP